MSHMLSRAYKASELFYSLLAHGFLTPTAVASYIVRVLHGACTLTSTDDELNIQRTLRSCAGQYWLTHDGLVYGCTRCTYWDSMSIMAAGTLAVLLVGSMF